MRVTHGIRTALLLLMTCTGRQVAAQAALATRPVTGADVRFMQDMIVHHSQAVEMTALLATRTRRADLRSLGERIAVSQTDEIDVMRRWLTRHGVPAPAAQSDAMAAHDAGSAHQAHDMHDMSGMPGMLNARQMTALRTARGPAFDRLFLRGMIQHHTGALTMVKALMATPGAAQESALNRFVNDVSADQRAEIARMRRLASGK